MIRKNAIQKRSLNFHVTLAAVVIAAACMPSLDDLTSGDCADCGGAGFGGIEGGSSGSAGAGGTTAASGGTAGRGGKNGEAGFGDFGGSPDSGSGGSIDAGSGSGSKTSGGTAGRGGSGGRGGTAGSGGSAGTSIVVTPGDWLPATATADSEENYPGKMNLAGHAVDGSIYTRWTANDPNLNHYLTLDFGAIHPLVQAEVRWEYPPQAAGGVYSYTLSTSTDGVAYEVVVDKSANTETGNPQFVSFPPMTAARYVRITVVGLPPPSASGGRTWAGIWEFRVYDHEVTGAGGMGGGGAGGAGSAGSAGAGGTDG